MIFRASAKFQKHFRCEVDTPERLVRPFPQTWNLDIFRHRNSQLVVLASEEYSLFSMLLPLTLSRNINQFYEAFQQRFLGLLENIRYREQPDFSSIRICARNDRRIIGSQNEFIFIARENLTGRGGLITSEFVQETEEEINSTPMSFLEMKSPEQAVWMTAKSK